MTPEDSHLMIRQLISGDPAAAREILAQATTSIEPLVLTAAALLDPGTSSLLDRATSSAVTTRDRQLAALAAAHIAGNHDLVSALAREHLLDHPDSVLAAWIASGASRPTLSPAVTRPVPTSKES
jgi:hypothetical protein